MSSGRKEELHPGKDCSNNFDCSHFQGEKEKKKKKKENKTFERERFRTKGNRKFSGEVGTKYSFQGEF